MIIKSIINLFKYSVQPQPQLKKEQPNNDIFVSIIDKKSRITVGKAEDLPLKDVSQVNLIFLQDCILAECLVVIVQNENYYRLTIGGKKTTIPCNFPTVKIGEILTISLHSKIL